MFIEKFKLSEEMDGIEKKFHKLNFINILKKI